MPSSSKGLVTTATVKIPSSLATCATIGAAPVSVPPPMPAVTKTISVPFNISLNLSLSSRAASRPIAGFAPAPNPSVISFPRISFVLASFLSNACLSVFTEMNSAPLIPDSTMCCTAFPPPPPTPITFIEAFSLTSSIISHSLIINLSFNY